MKSKLNVIKGLLSIPCTLSIKLTAVIIFLCFNIQLYAQNEEDLKKQAETLFEEEDYTKAYKLYSQLLSNHQQDPLYNYRVGVCMIYSEPDKKKSFSYLNKAYNNRQELPKDVTFFLGKAYHINYLFDEAIRFYNEFKKEAPSSMQKKLQVEREIRACGHGKRLLSTITDLQIISKKQLNESDYFRSYDLSTTGGKFLVKTDNFKTGTDKRKKDKSILYSNKSGERIYFSSYGDNSVNGKDIYYRERIAGGEFGKPIIVEGINTEFDEDYPFVHPNGNVIYFASKGHNSMGGYDIFKSTYNESTQSWSTPKNMEFPINSPDDDYLFVTDSSEKFAYFSTGRYSPPGKIDVLKIKTERKPIDFIMMKGSVAKETAKQSVKSKITVKNIGTGNLVGTFEADDAGNFTMQLPNGAKLLYTVETPELRTQSQGISLPVATVGKPFKQTVTYVDGVLKIINNFEEAPSDDNYLQYLKLIEEKSKLNPNEGENKLSPQTTDNAADTLLADTKNPDAVKTTNPTINSTNNNKNNTTKANDTKIKSSAGTNNKELIDIAKQDAFESEKETIALIQDANDAKELGQAKKIEAETKITEANTALAKAEAITDEALKTEETNKAIALKTEGENDLAVANKIIDYSKTLEKDAANKAKETALNKQYASELEKLSNPKNNTPEAKQKLDEIQKQIAEVSEQKSESENSYANLKNEVSEKEKELAIATEKTTALKNDLTTIQTDISKTETELNNARKKKEKSEINTRLSELKTELTKQEADIAQSEAQETKINIELNALKSELALTDKIKTETIAKVNPTSNITTNPTNNDSNSSINKTGTQQLEEKYASKINITDADNKDNIASVNKQLVSYNKDIDNQITKNKASLAKTKKPDERKALTSEIKNLEATKKQNQQSIANNNARIADLNKQIASNNAPNNNQNLKEIQTDNPSKALDQLKEIKNSLTQADNVVFNYNSYSNTTAQNQKVQADGQINDVYALQNKLKETIAKSEENINNASVNLTKNSNNPDAILNEADALSAKATTLRSEAKTKEGAEKDKLIAEAVDLEKQSQIKQIEASEVGSKINIDKYDVNKENIETLLGTNKTDAATISQSKALIDEADQAIKQAKAIREEANAQTNNGAKIGNLGNAEEKEAIALAKQNEALNLLKKQNPDVALKPYKDLNTVNITNEAVLKEEIAKVNAELKQLIAAKTNAYTTLSTANQEEIKTSTATLQANTTIANTPALKSQMVVINKNIEEIAALKTKIDASTNDNEKLVTYSNLVKKENETLLAINKLNADAENKAVAVNTKTTETTKDNTSATDNTNTNNTENKNENTTTKNNNENASANKTVFTNEQLNSAFTVDLSYENHKDTSINQINNYFATNNFELRNTQANSQKNSSLDALKGLENETTQLNDAIAKSNSEQVGENPENLNNTQISSKINSLLEASDNLAAEASKVKMEADAKSGDEKEALLLQAKELNEKSFNKKVEAAQLTQQFNEANYNANSNAINDMIASINTRDPNLAASFKAKLEEIENKKKQAKNIREEANGLSNNTARLGAMGNAEEEEAFALQKQNEIINELKKEEPNYVTKEPTYNNISGSKDIPADIKLKQNDINSKLIAELTNLINAFSLEYETNKNLVPKNLNAEQNKLKNNVIGLNAESKNLLIKSTQTSNPTEKLKLLSLAAKTGHTAATQLSVLINKQATNNVAVVNNKVNTSNATNLVDNKNNTTIAVNKNNNTTIKNNNTTVANTNKNNTTTNKNNTTNANTNDNNTVANTNKNATSNNTNNKVLVRVEGLEVLNKNAYSAAKPIPIDAKMPDGLVFRVQIGAFKTKIADNSFRGLTPVNGETTANGYTRYTAGNFNKLGNASAVKNDLNKNGYPDAFVVVFFNGKRITMAEALAMLEREGKTPDVGPNTVGISENVNPNNNVVTPKTTTEIPVVITKELEKTKNLLYTVQIGVYSRQISKARLSNLTPIYSELLPNGLYRYTAGIYNNTDKVINDKRRVINLGIKDAFVSAYLDGKRLPFNDAKAKKESDSTVQFEPENPIVFPETGAVESTPAIVPAAAITPTFAPFTNGVKDKPVATPENGIKENDEGITFKVQIGAYSKPVPDDVAYRFNSIKNWPIENKVVNGLYLYNVGSYNDAKFAKQLKDEVVSLGISDAFITVYKDGVKLFGAERDSYLSK